MVVVVADSSCGAAAVGVAAMESLVALMKECMRKYVAPMHVHA